jgi:hypothetical protein
MKESSESESVKTEAAHEKAESTVEKDDELLKEARRRYKLSSDFWADNRQAFADDLDFSYVDQWPQYAKDAFGIDSLITINRQISFNRQVTNDMRQNRASIKVRPVDDGADVETAEVLQGLIRHIEANSKADLAYDTADRYSVEGGFGFYRVITDYKKDSFDQEIYIKEIDNPLSVLPDYKFSADGATWDYCFIHDDMPKKDFENSNADAIGGVDWEGDGLDVDGWVTDDSVRVCEYFYKERIDDTLCLLKDGRVIYKSDYKQMGLKTPIEQERKQWRDKIKWCKFAGNKILERADWAGSYIPVIPVYGDVVVVGGKHITISLCRYAKDAQRMVNYSRTKQAELEALAPKAPYIMAAGQDEGFEDDWANANSTNFSSLKYNPVDINGQLAPPPQRQQYAGAPVGVITLGQMAEQDMMAIIGIHEAGLGQRSNETSGAAIVARQREGDNSTFNFIDNTTRARRQCGIILVDLIPHIYDTPRVVRILGEDDSQKTVKINEAEKIKKEGKEISRIYDLSVGQYDVVCSAGASYTTKRAEGAAFLERVAGSNPDLMKLVGDLVFKAQDMPYADEIAERLQKTLPPEMQQHEDDEEGDQAPQLPPEVMQKMQEHEQTIQQMDHVIQQMQAELDDKQAKEQAEAQKLALESAKLELERFRAATDRLLAMHEIEIKDLKESEKVQADMDFAKVKIDMAEDHDIELKLLDKKLADGIPPSPLELASAQESLVDQDEQEGAQGVSIDRDAMGNVTGVNGRPVVRDAEGNIVGLA